MAKNKYIPTAALIVVGLGIIVLKGFTGDLESTMEMIGGLTMTAGVVMGTLAASGK